jgi:hypothetical protein
MDEMEKFVNILFHTHFGCVSLSKATKGKAKRETGQESERRVKEENP